MFKQVIFLLMFFLFAAPALASSDGEVSGILALSEAPAGVVFELLGDDDDLEIAIPKVQESIKKLRARFPELAIAIVSHGDEQFVLLQENADSYSAVHSQVQSLVNEQNVQVHVCATYARWHGLNPEDFPDYVDVVSQGPSQISDYVESGYILILVDI